MRHFVHIADQAFCMAVGWGRLTDDLNRAAGKCDVLAGILQEKYGYIPEAAVAAIDTCVTDGNMKPG